MNVTSITFNTKLEPASFNKKAIALDKKITRLLGIHEGDQFTMMIRAKADVYWHSIYVTLERYEIVEITKDAPDPCIILQPSMEVEVTIKRPGVD